MGTFSNPEKYIPVPQNSPRARVLNKAKQPQAPRHQMKRSEHRTAWSPYRAGAGWLFW
ncbi:hypothetical protein GGTG_06550 [Gaeumannomyces tritici R3-111a-1]|uniref:Uncharacterized protein n=1 Tax=Gaeumannomyces tritici (strain R3-111a-1) TaxID=644352 RepID=J3NZ50_GAET3|nr:hypothetical protein GGTG_06550 [Gaeumannomyces tritici R3-111a-1]EJT76633.1 hypothetical protein GGTG_06550 [Gaeumannomyces tritici R3-111a-1]